MTEYSYIEEKYNLDGFIPKPSTALTEATTIEVSIPEEPVHIPQIEVINTVNETNEETSKVDQVKTEESTSEESQTIESAAQAGNELPEPAPAAEGEIAADQQPPATAELTDETPVPPAINNQKTENGCTSFKDLILPGISPSYIPNNASPAIKEDSDPSLSDQRSATKKPKTSGKGNKRVEDDLPDATMLEKRDPKAYKIKREKMYGDERFARPGKDDTRSAYYTKL